MSLFNKSAEIGGFFIWRYDILLIRNLIQGGGNLCRKLIRISLAGMNVLCGCAT